MRVVLVSCIFVTTLLAMCTLHQLFLNNALPQDPWKGLVAAALTDSSVEHIDATYRTKMIDCSDESFTFGREPLHSYKFIELFSGQMDPFNGFYTRNKLPLYFHTQGVSRITENSPIFIGFRGDTAGPHRSLLTPKIHQVYSAQPTGVMFMAGSYVKYSNGVYQNVCHRRHYREYGYIGSDWPAISDEPWHPINKFFGNHGHLFLFSYSNGGVVKDQMMETSVDLIGTPTLDRAKEYGDEFTVSSLFKYPRDVNRIQGIIDIETNYSRRNIWDLIKFLKSNVESNPQNIYYGATTIEGAMALNHVFLIRALGLKGKELDTGVIRYTNPEGNITVDFVTHLGYWYGSVNLASQTTFERNPKLRYRLYTGHYKIVAYAVDNFYQIAKQRKILF